MENAIYDWLMQGDPAICYLVKNDLLNQDDQELHLKMLQEGWIKTLLAHQNENGHWGDGFYRPKWI